MKAQGVRSKKANGAEVWEKVSAHARNEMLDVTVYSLAAIKSCVTSDDFWTELTEEKKPARSRSTSRTLDVY